MMGQVLFRPDFDPLFFSNSAFSDPESDRVFHGFFSRNGGQSKGIYAGLNCGPGSGDNPDCVEANRRLVSEIVGCAPDCLLSLHQIHSAVALSVSEPWSLQDRPQADGMATDREGLALAILTADCAPVLFCGRKADGQPVVGAAHAGWKGALGGVMEATLEQMKGLGALPESLKAFVGPCIGKAFYEVSDSFAEPFKFESSDNERFFSLSVNEGHLMFDLPAYCAAKLADFGVGQVFIKDLDTYFNEDDFYSFRRTTHRKDVDYGRQVSVIMIRVASGS